MKERRKQGSLKKEWGKKNTWKKKKNLTMFLVFMKNFNKFKKNWINVELTHILWYSYILVAHHTKF
jgi:hypothetical protein